MLSAEESRAVSDMLLKAGYLYARELLSEAGIIDEDEYVIENIISKLKDAAKSGAEHAKRSISTGIDHVKHAIELGTEKAKELSGKLKSLYEFLIKIVKRGIKTAKEAGWEFADLMSRFGCSFDDLLTKLKVNKKIASAKFMMKAKIFFNVKNIKNVTIYNEDKEAAVLSPNEYEQIQKNGNIITTVKKEDIEGESWGGIIGNFLLTVLMNCVLYVGLQILGGVIGAAFGGAAGAVLGEIIAKIMWGSTLVWYQIHHEAHLHKTGRFDELYDTKAKKVVHNIMFVFNVAWGAYKAVSSAGKLIDLCMNEKLLATMLPSATTQAVCNGINSIKKSAGFSSVKGFDDLQKTIDSFEHKIISTAAETVNVHSGKMDLDNIKEFATKKWDSSIQACKYFMKDAMSEEQLKQIASTKGENTLCNCFVNGAFDKANKWTKNIIKYAKDCGYSEEDVTGWFKKGKLFNIGLNSMNAHAGSANAVQMPIKFILYMKEHNLEFGHDGFGCALGTESLMKTVKTTIGSVKAVVNSLDLFGGFMKLPEFAAADKKGWFVMRNGSSMSNAYLYDISECREYKFGDAEKEFKDNNPAAFDDMLSIIKQNNDRLRQMLQDDSIQDEKLKGNIKKAEKTMAEAQNKKKSVFVLFGKWLNLKDNEESEDLVPVALFNNIIMCVIDLAPSDSKGARNTAVYYKGLLDNYEFLPKENGMTEKEINDWLESLLKNGFKISYNSAAVKPCRKHLLKWELIKDNAVKDDEPRPELGNFTNKELLQIAADDNIFMLLSTKHKEGKDTEQNQNIEQSKEKQEKFVKNLEKGFDKAKEGDNGFGDLFARHPKLKDKLKDDNGNWDNKKLNDLSRFVIHTENFYKNNKKRESFWSRFKNWLFGRKNDNESNDGKLLNNLIDTYGYKTLKDMSQTIAKVNTDNVRKGNAENKAANESLENFNGECIWQFFEDYEIVVKQKHSLKDMIYESIEK